MERAFTWTVAWIWVTVRSGFVIAGSFCTSNPSHDERTDLDRSVVRLEIAGLVAVGCAHTYWLGWPRPDVSWLKVGAAHAVIASARTVGTLALCSLLALLVLALVGGRHRRAIWQESRGPVAALATTVTVAAGWWAFLMFGNEVVKLGDGSTVVGTLLGLTLSLLVLSAVLALLGASGAVLWFGGRHRMRILEGPLFLLPLSVLLTAVIALTESVVTAMTEGLRPGYPVWVAVVTAFLGPCLAVVLAGYGFLTLRRGSGILAPRALPV